MTTLACMVLQKILMKNFIIQSMERKKIEQIKGRISSRRLIHNPTIRHVVSSLYTKCVYSSLHGCEEILDEKIEGADGKTDGEM